MPNISSVYKKLPTLVKGILKYGYSCLRLRLGNKFYRELKFLEKSQEWNKKEMLAYQNSQLKQLIVHAVTKVPYYRDLFRQLNLTPEDIRDIAVASQAISPRGTWFSCQHQR